MYKFIPFLIGTFLMTSIAYGDQNIINKQFISGSRGASLLFLANNQVIHKRDESEPITIKQYKKIKKEVQIFIKMDGKEYIESFTLSDDGKTLKGTSIFAWNLSSYSIVGKLFLAKSKDQFLYFDKNGRLLFKLDHKNTVQKGAGYNQIGKKVIVSFIPGTSDRFTLSSDGKILTDNISKIEYFYSN